MSGTEQPGGNPARPILLALLRDSFFLCLRSFQILRWPILSIALLASILHWLLALGDGSRVLAVLIQILLTLFMEVSVFRTLALNETPPSWGLRLSAREFRYLGTYLMLFMGMLLVLFVLGAVFSPILMVSHSGGGGILFAMVVGLGFYYFYLRLMPALVAIALDAPGTAVTHFTNAWTLTRGSGGSILLASLAVMLPIWVVTLTVAMLGGLLALQTGITMLAIVPELVVIYAGLAIKAGLHMAYYRRIGGWIPS